MLSPNTTYHQAAGGFKSFRSPAISFQPWAVSPQLSDSSRWLNISETQGGFPLAARSQAPGVDHHEVRTSQEVTPEVHCNHQLPFILHRAAACHQLRIFGCPLDQHISEVACVQGLTGRMDFTAPARNILKSSSRATQRRVFKANIRKTVAQKTPCLQETVKRQRIPNQPAFRRGGRGKRKKKKAGSASLHSPFQQPPWLLGGGAALLISGLFLAHSPHISSPAGPREQFARF